MRGNIVKAGLFGLLALLLVIMPLIGACAPEAPEVPEAPPEVPEVEKPSTVKVAYLADLTGPYAAVGAPLLEGFADYMEMTNEKGGIDGVPIQVLWADTKADAALTTAAYKRFRSQDILALSCMVTPVALAIKSIVNEDEIPAINQSATMSLYMPPTKYMWCHGFVESDYALTALYWFDTELWNHDEWGDWTLGILAHDNPFALGGVSAMYKYADTYGVNLVQPEVVSLGTLDFSPNIQRLVDAGADVIYCATLGAASGTALKQMGDLGILGTIEEAATIDGRIVPMFSGTSYLPAQLKAAHDECAYTYGSLPYGLATEVEFPGVKATNDFMISKYGEVIPPEEGGSAYRDGWNNGLVMVSAIKRALEAVGWENLNGEAVVEKGLMGLAIDPQGTACTISYVDYEGDRIAIQTMRPATWDMESWDRTPIGPCLNIPELLPECEVSDYMTTQGGTGWYTP